MSPVKSASISSTLRSESASPAPRPGAPQGPPTPGTDPARGRGEARWSSSDARCAGVAEEEQPRAARVAHDAGEERQAVGVGPLEIVDGQHHRPALGEAAEELAEREEEPGAEHLRVERARLRARGLRDELDSLHHREDLPDEPALAREDGGEHALGERGEPAAERVDDPVDGLVRDALALVAAAREDDGIGLLGDEPVGEAADERALPHARLPVGEEGHAAVLPRRREGSAQRLELHGAADEVVGVPLDGGDVPRLLGGEDAEDLGAARPRGRVDAQEIHGAERVEIVGDDGDRGCGAGGSNDCLRMSTSRAWPEIGRRPVSAWNRSTPTLYQSAAGPTCLSPACSGAMYENVPTRCDSGGMSSRSATRPKSSTTTRPSRVTRMLEGLMSRWIFLARWRASSPSASWAKAERRRLVGAGGELAAAPARVEGSLSPSSVHVGGGLLGRDRRTRPCRPRPRRRRRRPPRRSGGRSRGSGPRRPAPW